MSLQPAPSLPITSLHLQSFRCFSSLSINKFQSQNLILGGNGSGKTSVVWALLLLLRGYNTCAKTSQHTNARRVRVERLDELADLFNYPGLSNSSFGEILGAQPGVVGGNVAGIEFTCSYKTNGILELHPAQIDPPVVKIRFAFMGSETFFATPRKELDDVDILSSAVTTVRKLYRPLSTTFKAPYLYCAKMREDIQAHLRDLFGIKSLEERDKDILVTEEGCSTPFEIMHTGSAMRKVFHALVFLYTLASAQDKEHPVPRVFFIEEPEALLHDALQKSFVNLVLYVSQKSHIQVFMTSNSGRVYEFFKPEEITVLWNRQACTVEHSERMAALLELRRFGISASHRPLLITEGKNDPDFLRRIAGLFHIDTSGLALSYSANRFPEKEEVSAYFASLICSVTGTTTAKVRVLRDRDFRASVPATPEKSELVTFWWDVPSIESYLFLYACGRWSRERQGEHPGAFLREPAWEAKFATHFLNGYKYREPKVLTASTMFRRWSEALAAANKESPTSDDFRAIAEVLHGHTWVEEVKQTKTAVLTNAVQEDIAEFCPELVDKVRRIFKS